MLRRAFLSSAFKTVIKYLKREIDPAPQFSSGFSLPSARFMQRAGGFLPSRRRAQQLQPAASQADTHYPLFSCSQASGCGAANNTIYAGTVCVNVCAAKNIHKDSFNSTSTVEIWLKFIFAANSATAWPHCYISPHHNSLVMLETLMTLHQPAS